MRQADVHEKAVRHLTNGMNLVDIKVYADEDGEVQAVLLKYIDPKYGKAGDQKAGCGDGPEIPPFSGAIPRGPWKKDF